MIIRVTNLLDSVSPYTFLTQQEASGAGTIHVQNVAGPSAQWAIQIGQTGEEKSEIRVLNASTPSGGTYVFGTVTSFSHPIDTPVYAIKYDKIIIKRSTSGTGGAASALATLAITPDQKYTQYDDTTGASTYAYKTAFYNSVLDASSDDSDWVTPSGYDFYSLAKIKERVKDKLFSAGFIGNDDVIKDWINEYLEIMTNAAIDVNADYSLGSTQVTFSGSGELGTITASDFKQIRRMWMTNDNANFYEATKMDSTDVIAGQVFNATYPYFFMYGENVISRWPHDTGGTACILYYKLNTVLSNETDNLPVSMRGYTKGFVDYSLAQAYYKDGKTDIGIKKENDAMRYVERYKKDLTPRNKTGQDFIKISEVVSEDIPETWFV